MEKIELLAPAGDLERLKIAVLYGADAVYIGGKQFSLRSRASNFDIEDIAEGVKFAHEHGSKVHVTVNMLPHEEDLEGLKEYLQALEAVGVDAIIAASPSIMMCAKQYAPKLEVHVSTQHSSTNSMCVKYWQKKGMDRVVLARECSLDQILETTKNSDFPIEVFIHGGMCISYSGRCVLSNHMTNRDANRGGCAQSCRWKYSLYGNEGALYDEKDLFSMSSKDLLGARFLEQLIEAGVASLKIEGRMKSSYYVATLVSTYRALIDEIYEHKHLSEERYEYYANEFSKAENRPTATGFYLGYPKACDQLYGVNGAGVTQEYIAYVLDYNPKNQVAILQVRNNFKAFIEAEVFGPGMKVTKFNFDKLYDLDGNEMDVARNPMQIIQAKVPIEMKKDCMIRKIMIKDRSDIY